MIVLQFDPMLIDLVRTTFAERRQRNASYSLRAYAKSLAIDSSTLSALMNGKRPLTPKTAKKLLTRLNEGQELSKSDLLLATLEPEADGPKRYTELDAEAFTAIASWEHFAILSWLEVKGANTSVKAIATRFGLSVRGAQAALDRMERLGLVRCYNDRWRPTGHALTTSTDVPSASLREAHRQTIAKAVDAIEAVAVEQRDITGITMAVNAAKLGEAKVLIKDFRRRLARLLEDGQATDVYRLNVQLFPLSKPFRSRHA